MKLACFIAALIICALACDNENKCYEKPNNLVDKKVLNGEWYARAVLVDKHSHNMFANIGLECPVQRVKFEITKDKLLAFQSLNSGNTNKNEVIKQKLVAAFNIENHLNYNEKFGSFGGGFWKNREYMKVDWSRNLAPAIDCNQWLNSITELNLENNSENINDKYAVKLNDDYIETTINALVVPDQKACDALGELNCLSAQYRAKFSFKKINENNDYQRRIYPDFESIKYGNNGENKICLEDENNCSNIKELWVYDDGENSQKICDPKIHDISKCYSPKIKANAQFGFFRSEVDNYSHREGRALESRKIYINRWNIWKKSIDAKGEIIPLENRVPKKITYYLNAGFPRELYPSIKKVAHDWNIALANVIAKIKNNCELKTIENIFYSNEAVRKLFLANNISSINEDNLSRSCNLLHEYSKNKQNKLVFFAGDYQEIIDYYGNVFEIRINDCNSDNIRTYLEQNLEAYSWLNDQGMSFIKDGNIEEVCAVLENESRRLKKEHIFTWQQFGDLRYSFVNGVNKLDGIGLLGYGPSGVDPLSGEIISGNANIYLPAILENATNAVLLMAETEALELANKTHEKNSLEKEVLSVIERFYESPFMSDIDSTKVYNQNKWTYPQLRSLREINMADIELEEKDSNKKHQFLSERNACFAHDLAPTYGRIINEIKNKNIEEKISFLNAKIVEHVLLHEIGHTLGLRHNFMATSDALNYLPDFWQVKGEKHLVRERLSKEELRSSSIMDYHKYFNSDFSGLGMYDYAALLFGYGEKIEIFNDDKNDFISDDIIKKIDLINYKDLPILFSGKNAAKQINDEASLLWDQQKKGLKLSLPLTKARKTIGNAENLYRRKAISIEEVKKDLLQNLLAGAKKKYQIVPYKFCTDGQVLRDDIFCQPFIFGASFSEMVESSINDYERIKLLNSLQIKTNYIGPEKYINRVYRAVYRPIISAYQDIYKLKDSKDLFYSKGQDLAKTVKLGLDLISRTLQSVEPGEYCLINNNYVLRKDNENCIDSVMIDEKRGQKFASSYSAGLLSVPVVPGAFYDKIMALLALTDENAVLENSASIGLYYGYSEEILNIFSAFYLDDRAQYSPEFNKLSNNIFEIKYNNFFEVKNNQYEPIKIMASSSNKLQEYSVLISMNGFKNASKLDFNKRAYISSFENKNQALDDGGLSILMLTDPMSQMSYKAHNFANNKISLGYKILKDAYDFISDGQKAGEQAGPWFVAKSALYTAKANSLSPNLNYLESREDDVEEAQKVFDAQNKRLAEKMRVIQLIDHLVQKYSL